jgi:UDP-2-acetamido-3-amino-2,3-dideoxy-glucuronate N-acetyltransferase
LEYFVHESSYVGEGAKIGKGTKIWHFCNVMSKVDIGDDCSFGQNVFIANNVKIGNGVKVQNNVSIYEGVEIEDFAFCGPSMVFTNVLNPRCEFPQRGSDFYGRTLVRRGASIGANATIVCGNTIGRYAFIAAGTVITKDVADYALMAGVPGRRIGWMSRHGERLANKNVDGIYTCPRSGWQYKEVETGILRCLDQDEDAVVQNK